MYEQKVLSYYNCSNGEALRGVLVSLSFNNLRMGCLLQCCSNGGLPVRGKVNSYCYKDFNVLLIY